MTLYRLFICALVLPFVAMNAQSVVSVAGRTQGAVVSDERPVTLSMRGVTVKEALTEIARQSGVIVRMGDDVLTSKARVNVALSGATAREAVAVVLKGTGFEVENSAVGGMLVTRGATRGKQSQGVIAGKVTDAKTGHGVSGATMSIDNDTRGVSTNDDGSYRITGVSTGTHIVTVRLLGYAKQARSISVGEGVTVTVDFKLEPSASVLDQVVVTGTVIASELRSVPNAITVITAKQIEERGITRIDQLFRGDIPGLFAANRGSDALLDEVVMFSRGATALSNSSAGTTANIAGSVQATFTNPIKTYVDGVELANPLYLSQIDPASIERIEILTGPQASTIYGSNTINGVMQVFTKRGSTARPQVIFNLESGVAQNNFSSHLAPNHVADFRVSGVEGRVSYNVGGSWNYIGAWTPSKQTQRLGGNGGGRMDLGKLNIDVSARNGLTQNRQRGDQMQGWTDLRATGLWKPDATAGLTRPVTSALIGQTLGLTLSYRPLAWWSHELGLGTDASTTTSFATEPRLLSESDTTLDVTSSATSRASEWYTTTMQIPMFMFAHLNLTFGGDHWRTKGSVWNAKPIVLVGSFPCINNSSCSHTKPGKNSGAFVQGQLSLNDMLFFTYGIRAEWNRTIGDKAHVLPGRYGVSYARDIGPLSAKLRASYGRSTRPPGDGQKLAVAQTGVKVSRFGPFNTILANPELVSEHQQGGEGGLELYLGSHGSLVITRYNQTVDNLISQAGNGRDIGIDSVRSLDPIPNSSSNCSSNYRDADGYCYAYQTQYLNVGSIRNQGWELQGSVNIGPFTTHGTYSWTKSRVLGITPKYRGLLQSTNPAFQPGRPLDFAAEHTWALGITYAHTESTVSLSINGIGMLYKGNSALGLLVDNANRFSTIPPRFELPNGYRSAGPGYTTADINATHRFTVRIDALLQVNNLTNYYQNDFFSSSASIGRQTKLGLRFKLQ